MNLILKKGDVLYGAYELCKNLYIPGEWIITDVTVTKEHLVYVAARGCSSTVFYSNNMAPELKETTSEVLDLILNMLFKGAKNIDTVKRFDFDSDVYRPVWNYRTKGYGIQEWTVFGIALENGEILYALQSANGVRSAIPYMCKPDELYGSYDEAIEAAKQMAEPIAEHRDEA
jgi:transcription initiation factor IIE alpha subunit